MLVHFVRHSYLFPCELSNLDITENIKYELNVYKQISPISYQKIKDTGIHRTDMNSLSLCYNSQ